jgi:hypothetical protein
MWNEEVTHCRNLKMFRIMWSMDAKSWHGQSTIKVQRPRSLTWEESCAIAFIAGPMELLGINGHFLEYLRIIT